MWFVVFILGILFGSFFNVCIYRIPNGESIVFPPSHCTRCKHKLKSLDLIPIFSYLFLKGKCRYCGEKISLRYPCIEFLTGLIWMLIYLRYKISIDTIKYIFLISIMIIMSMIDYDSQEVYFSVTLTGIIGGLIFIILEIFLNQNSNLVYKMLLKNYTLGAMVPAVFIALIAFLTKGMGTGDIEVVFLCGLFLGFKKSILLMLLSFIIGGIVSIFLMCLSNKEKTDAIAFVPFIGIACLITILFGDNIIFWYLGKIMNIY